ncbi:MAG: Coenzyme F420 hydrogenase/dehydrogenase, beta subunit C-terminal domain [Candidatus Saliniplasma sp.]
MYVEDVRKSNLCLSCEICNAVCPTDAVEMEYRSGQFLPKIDDDKCIDCRLCLKLCPGKVHSSGIYNKDFKSTYTGKFLDTYSLFTKDWEILDLASSGGAVTTLLIGLLEDGKYDGAFVLDFDMFHGESTRLTLTKDKDGVKAASKSKYIPASVFHVIKTLEQESSPNYVIVGTPCQINGIKKYIREKGIEDEGLLFFGLFCDKTLNFNLIRYFQNKYAEKQEKLVKLDYENKEKNGWLGDVKLYFDSGRELIVDRCEMEGLKDHFQLERCLYCLDKLCRGADISFGTCYIEGKDHPGRSNIIVRTEKGKNTWESYKDLFEWEKVSIRSIQGSQKISKEKKKLEFRNVLKEKAAPKDIKKELSKRKEYIRRGRKNKFRKIEQSSQDRKKFDLVIRSGMTIGKTVIKDLFSDITRRSHAGENVIILGGELYNKGAQAMTFTVVDQIKKRFPKKQVYLFKTRDFDRDEIEKQMYTFEIKPWDVLTRVNLLSSNKTFSQGESPYLKHYEDIENIMEKCSFVIDISGYALSSQMGNPDAFLPIKEFDYLLNIIIAKRYGIPFYIFPQSIGPFEYSPIQKTIIYPMMKKYLKYPKKIFPREKKGVESIKEFTRENVEHARDIVLMNKGYDLDNILSEQFEFKNFEILQNSVGIVPNSQIMKRGEPEQIYSIYEAMIQELLQSKKVVYILRHSHEDFEICRNIKGSFSDNDDVRFIAAELNAVELEDIITELDFIIGSRYHSIIHAYKNRIPALVLGWAVKYKELMEDFDQLEYHFDSRDLLDKKKVLEKLKRLMKRYPTEKKVLDSRLKQIHKNKTVFEKVF